VTTVIERKMAAWRDKDEPVEDRVGRDVARQFGTPPSLLKTLLVGLILLFSVIALSGLGVWQVQRRVWKLDLIERVEQRVRATPTDAPGPESWPNINASDYAYRHVSVRGRFVKGRSTLVRAVTERGRGYWLVEPLQASEGFTVLINRGFIPSDRTTRSPPGREQPDAVTTITGLLRMTEPGGGFLHQNDPTSGSWYSRDVAAIANAKGIERVAPYFIDADASVTPSDLAIGGLTVISFPNNHLIYALTWFGLVAMLSIWTTYLFYYDWQRLRYLGASHRVGISDKLGQSQS
jgi:surfeit locus 1 family protein